MRFTIMQERLANMICYGISGLVSISAIILITIMIMQTKSINDNCAKMVSECSQSFNCLNYIIPSDENCEYTYRFCRGVKFPIFADCKTANDSNINLIYTYKNICNRNAFLLYNSYEDQLFDVIRYIFYREKNE